MAIFEIHYQPSDLSQTRQVAQVHPFVVSVFVIGYGPNRLGPGVPIDHSSLCGTSLYGCILAVLLRVRSFGTRTVVFIS